MKKLLIGFILGIMFSGVCYATSQYTATKVDYKVYINGKQYDSTSKPVLNVDGSTYLPLRNAAEALNVPIKWDTSNGRVELGTPLKDDATSTVSPTTSDNVSIVFYGIYDIDGIPTNVGDTTKEGIIKITNNGTKNITIKSSGSDYSGYEILDLKVNYKLKSGETKSFTPRLAIKKNDTTFSDIKPGETRTLVIGFDDSGNRNRDIESYSCIWKGQNEFKGIPDTSK